MNMKILGRAFTVLLILTVVYLLWARSPGSQNTESGMARTMARANEAVRTAFNGSQRDDSISVSNPRRVGKTDLSVFGNQPTRPTNHCVETTIGQVWDGALVANDSKKGYALIQEVSPETPILFDQEHGWAWKKACLNRITPYVEEPAEEPAPAPEPVQRVVSQPEQPVCEQPQPQPVCEQPYCPPPAPTGLFVGIVTNIFGGRQQCQQDYYQPGCQQNYQRNNCQNYSRQQNCYQPRQQQCFQPRQQQCYQPRQQQCYPPRQQQCYPPRLVRPVCPQPPPCRPAPICGVQQGRGQSQGNGGHFNYGNVYQNQGGGQSNTAGQGGYRVGGGNQNRSGGQSNTAGQGGYRVGR